MKKIFFIFLLLPSLCFSSDKWETVVSYSDNKTILYRAKVPHGWLVKSVRWAPRSGTSESITFYPDENHDWEKSEFDMGSETESYP